MIIVTVVMFCKKPLSCKDLNGNIYRCNDINVWDLLPDTRRWVGVQKNGDWPRGPITEAGPGYVWFPVLVFVLHKGLKFSITSVNK